MLDVQLKSTAHYLTRDVLFSKIAIIYTTHETRMNENEFILEWGRNEW